MLGRSCPLPETTFKGKMATGRYLQDFQVQMNSGDYRCVFAPEAGSVCR